MSEKMLLRMYKTYYTGLGTHQYLCIREELVENGLDLLVQMEGAGYKVTLFDKSAAIEGIWDEDEWGTMIYDPQVNSWDVGKHQRETNEFAIREGIYVDSMLAKKWLIENGYELPEWDEYEGYIPAFQKVSP